MTLPILDTLMVWWDKRKAGELWIDKGGAMHFAYTPEWLADETAPALSHAMPKKQESFKDHACKAVCRLETAWQTQCHKSAQAGYR